MSLEMAQKVIVPQKKIMSRSFLNSGTLIVIAFFFWTIYTCQHFVTPLRFIYSMNVPVVHVARNVMI
jgi:hypothetical protein